MKNSYDAYATSVDITFENIGTDKGRIIIKDNGKGMSYDDLTNKWLLWKAHKLIWRGKTIEAENRKEENKEKE